MPRTMSPGVMHDVPDGNVVARVEIVEAREGLLLLSTNPHANAGLIHVVGGELTIDDSRNVQGMGTLEVVLDEATIGDVMPRDARGFMSPIADNYVQVSFRPTDDLNTVSHYGRYEIGDVELSEGSSGPTMSVKLYDFSRKVANARFFRPFGAGPGLFKDFMWHLISAVNPSSEIVVEDYPFQLGVHSWDVEDDRLAAVNELTSSVGYRIDWNFNGTGDVHFFPDPSEASDATWIFTADSDIRVTSAGRGLSDEKAYNGVIARGESTGSNSPPVTAEAWDLDPESPLYFDPNNPGASTFGPKPFFYVSQFITTYEQALGAAAARLPKVMGMTEVLTIETVRHPGIIPGDLIQVERPEVGITGSYIVQSVSLPLTNQMMTIVCRERRLLA